MRIAPSRIGALLCGSVAPLLLIGCYGESARAQSAVNHSPGLSGPSTSALVEVSDFGGVAFSPDKSLVAFRTETPSIKDNSVRLQWYVAPVKTTGASQLLASGGGPIWTRAGTITAERPQWSPNAQWLYYRALQDHAVQIFRANIATKAVEQVTHEPADILSFRLSDDGKSVTFKMMGADRAAIAADTAAQYRDGVLIDHKIDVGQALFNAVETDGQLSAERLNGAWFDRIPVLGDRPERYRSIVPGEQASREASVDEKQALQAADPVSTVSSAKDARSIDRRPDGAVAYVARENQSNVLRWSASEKQTTFRQCARTACTNAIAARWWGNRNRIVFTRAENANGTGAQSLWAWDIDRNTVRRLYRSDAQLDDGESEMSPFCQVGDSAAVCVKAEGSTPPKLVAIDLTTGADRILFAPNAALEAAIHIPTRWLSWTLDDHQVVSGQLLAPPSSKPLPLFISYYHCNGFMKGGTGDQYPFHAMAAAGIAVLCIQNAPFNFDVQGGNLIHYEIGRKAVLTAIRDLAARHIIDPKAVGMGGLSFGSEVTEWVAMHDDVLKAVSLSSGTLGLVYYYFNKLPGRDFLPTIKLAWNLGSPAETPAAWRVVAPSMNANHIKAATLFQLPEQEYRYNMELYDALIDQGTPTEMYAFPNERHITAQPTHRLAIYNRNLAWFKKWLLRVP